METCMNLKTAFQEICDFCGNYPAVRGGLPTDDPRAQATIVRLRMVGDWLREAFPVYDGVPITTVISEGAGAFPRVLGYACYHRGSVSIVASTWASALARGATELWWDASSRQQIRRDLKHQQGHRQETCPPSMSMAWPEALNTTTHFPTPSKCFVTHSIPKSSRTMFGIAQARDSIHQEISVTIRDYPRSDRKT